MRKLLFILSLVFSAIASMAAAPFVTTANLNLRTLPCTCAGIETTIPKGSVVYVLNYEDDEWARVSYRGHVNYVSRKYIRPVNNSENQYSGSSLRHSSTSKKYYTNSEGIRVQSPTRYSTAPAGATARCRDGSYSFSRHRRGTCSHHGGVAEWL